MRWLLRLLIFLGAVALLVWWRVPSQASLDQLAGAGKIHAEAPVKTSVSIRIHAPPERVWALLSDVAHWSRWEPDIGETSVSGPLAVGTQFSWVAGGATIHSRVACFQPGLRIGWTGHAFQATAVHIWTVAPFGSGETLVTTEESMDGFLIQLFFSSAKLEESDRRWLESLKAAAER